MKVSENQICQSKSVMFEVLLQAFYISRSACSAYSCQLQSIKTRWIVSSMIGVSESESKPWSADSVLAISSSVVSAFSHVGVLAGSCFGEGFGDGAGEVDG